jgi:hypothetical protein
MKKRKHHDYPIEIIFDWNPMQIDIPLDWTPTKAEAVVAILGLLDERIWNLYGNEIVSMHQTERVYCKNVDPISTSLDEDDFLPF